MIAFSLMHNAANSDRVKLFNEQVKPALERERVKYQIATDILSKGPWECARVAWDMLLTSREPYAMVLQDDMIPCHGFMDKIERFASCHDGKALCVFQPAAPWDQVAHVRTLMSMGCDFVIPEQMIAWGGSILFPTAWIRSVLGFAELLGGYTHQDDLRISRAIHHQGQPIINIGKSLLRHVGAAQSTIGNVFEDLEYATGYSFEG